MLHAVSESNRGHPAHAGNPINKEIRLLNVRPFRTIYFYAPLVCLIISGVQCKLIPSGEYSNNLVSALQFTSKPDAYSNDTTPTFTYEYTRDNITHYMCALDDFTTSPPTTGTYSTCSTTHNGGGTYSSTGTDDGTRRLNVQAYGNSNLLAEINHTWTLDTGWRKLAGGTGDAPLVTYRDTTMQGNQSSTLITVNTFKPTFTITNDPENEAAFEMGIVLKTTSTIPASTDVTSWVAFDSGLTFEFEFSSTWYAHVFLRDQADNASGATSFQVKVDVTPPSTKIEKSKPFTVSGLTLRVGNPSLIKNEDYLTFSMLDPSNPTDKTAGIAVPNLCSSLQDCSFNFLPLSTDAQSGCVNDFGSNCHSIVLENQNTAEKVAQAIADAVNRSRTATTPDAGLNTPDGESGPAIHATAIKDSVIFTPNIALIEANESDIDNGNNLMLRVTSTAVGGGQASLTKQSPANLRLPDYYVARVVIQDAVQIVDVGGNNAYIEIVDDAVLGTIRFVFNDDASLDQTTVYDQPNGANNIAAAIKKLATDNNAMVAQKFTQAVNEYFSNTTVTNSQNKIHAVMTRADFNSNYEIRFYRNDGTNEYLQLQTNLTTGTGFSMTIEPAGGIYIFPNVPHFFNGAYAGDGINPFSLLSTPEFGVESNLSGDYNHQRTCESWGTLNFSGTIDDFGSGPSQSAELQFKVQKTHDSNGNSVTGDQCFNGKYDSTANHRSSCSIWQSMDPTKISSPATGQQKWEFTLSIPKCALHDGGEGTYLLQARAMDFAGNADPSPEQLTFKWDSFGPITGPETMLPLVDPNTSGVLLSVPIHPLLDDVANHSLLIIRRNRMCDPTRGKIFCDHEIPKQGVIYNPSDNDYTKREIGGAVVVHVGPASQTEVWDLSLSPETTYHYRGFYFDEHRNYSNAYDIEHKAELPLPCYGQIIANERFERPNDVEPGLCCNDNPFNPIVPWLEFDEVFGLGDITHIFNHNLRFEPIENNTDIMGMAFLDLTSALQNSGPPSYETWVVLAPDGRVTDDTLGLEIQLFSHIDTTGVNPMNIPLNQSLIGDLGDNTDTPPVVGSQDNVASHIMAKIDIDPDNSRWDMSIMYYSQTAHLGTITSNYIGFDDTLIGSPTFDSMKPQNNGQGGNNTGYFFYVVGLKVAVTTDTYSNRGNDTDGDGAIEGDDGELDVPRTQPENIPDLRHTNDDGNVLPDMQVMLEIHKYTLDADGNFFDSSGTQVSTATPFAAHTLRTLPLGIDSATCSAFDPATMNTLSGVAAENCPPGTRFREAAGIGDDLTNPSYAGGGRDNQDQIFSPIYLGGHGTGIRARFQPTAATDESTTPSPRIHVRRVQVCEYQFLDELDAWSNFR